MPPVNSLLPFDKKESMSLVKPSLNDLKSTLAIGILQSKHLFLELFLIALTNGDSLNWVISFSNWSTSLPYILSALLNTAALSKYCSASNRAVVDCQRSLLFSVHVIELLP